MGCSCPALMACASWRGCLFSSSFSVVQVFLLLSNDAEASDMPSIGYVTSLPPCWGSHGHIENFLGTVWEQMT